MFKFIKKNKNKGFTLVELVIVIAILAILVGLLAPQYTKYVEKSRKTADVSNMDEMVKVIKVLAADPSSNLEAGGYTITIRNTKDTAGNNAKKNTYITAVDAIVEGTTKKTPSADSKTKVENALTSSIPSWEDTLTKSQKWGKDGKPSEIKATVIVNAEGGTSVSYDSPDAFKKYMETGSAE